jgi:chloramphenicol-sensitive protein RarD
MDDKQTRQGLMYGLLSYGLWGLIPLYFRAVGHVPPLQVVAHRIFWSFLLLAGVVAAFGRLGVVRRVLRSPSTRLALLVSTTLIAINWLTYIYAVSTDQVLQSSLGYFITPLMNVMLGVVVLHEKLRPWQAAAIVLALAGVLNMTLTGSSFPWIALTLAASFSVYGLVRKTVAADSLIALFVETMLVAPIALAYIGYAQATGQGVIGSGQLDTLAMLMLSGPVTAVPLLAFAAAARRLRYSTLGILQYLAPTIQFLLAVLVFGEPFPTSTMISFAFIWVAILIYTADSLRAFRSHTADRHIARRAAELDLTAETVPVEL